MGVSGLSWAPADIHVLEIEDDAVEECVGNLGGRMRRKRESGAEDVDGGWCSLGKAGLSRTRWKGRRRAPCAWRMYL